MKVCFLLDENLPSCLKPSILRHGDQIDIVRVGDERAPPLGTSDPDILRYVEVTRRLLVTNNRKSMLIHASAHLDAGGHHWEILWIRPNVGLHEVIEAIALI